MECEYRGCKHGANYFMGWDENGVKKFGYVCATHDKVLGRKNLMAHAGMTLKEAIEFEKYAKKTMEEE